MRSLRRGGGLAVVVHLVPVDMQAFDLQGHTSGLAGDHVLVLFSHEPVLHTALGGGRHVFTQPAPVPLLKALVLSPCYSVLRLQPDTGQQ